MKKSVFILLFAVLLLCVFTACGGNSDVNKTTSGIDVATSTASIDSENAADTEASAENNSVSDDAETPAPTEKDDRDKSDTQKTTVPQEEPAPTENNKTGDSPIELPFVPAE